MSAARAGDDAAIAHVSELVAESILADVAAGRLTIAEIPAGMHRRCFSELLAYAVLHGDPSADAPRGILHAGSA